MYIYICVYMYIYTFIYVYVFIHIDVYTYVSIHIIIYTYNHIIFQLSLLISFSKYIICLRQYYKFLFILSDLRHIYQCVLRQLQTKSNTSAMIARCKFIECAVGRKFS